MWSEEFQISAPKKICTPSIWEHISWASSSNIPPMSLVPFLCQDQRKLILSQRSAQWILASWKPALSFPSRLCHRVSGWLARKDPSPSQHLLGINSLGGPTTSWLYICFTFSSVLLRAPVQLLSLDWGHLFCLSITPQCKEICNTVVVWKSTLRAPRPGECTQLFYFWSFSLFSSQKSLIPVYVLGILPWTRYSSPIPPP